MLFLLLTMNSLWANDSYWHCTASDSEHKQWIEQSLYERAAISKAFDACKKHSHVPASCKVDIGVCEGFDHEMSIRPVWQCTALDEQGTTWHGQTNIDMDAAALSAKALCTQRSVAPDTCYINVLTCKNLNRRS